VFVQAIETATQFTRPIHSIRRYCGSTEVHPGASTLFFVNADGWALTCRHVAESFIGADQLYERYQAFKAERDSLSASSNRRQLERVLERKHGFEKGKIAELRNRVVGCVEGALTLSFILHPVLDIALVKFSDYTTLGPRAFPTFGAPDDALKQGLSLCRLGFPFPEFTNFGYDPASDTIDWTEQGRDNTPSFPLDGMVTRHLASGGNEIVGFELSTPGLRGQSGGPAFDAFGRVWGMQFATHHLDLDFDVDLEVYRDGVMRHVKDSAVLHVGHCFHVSVLKQFMREHDVAFAEG
jgi:hypothetical protein